MKRVQATTLLLAAGLLVLSLSPNVYAQVKDGIDETTPETGPNCDVTGYKTERQVFTDSVRVPDNNPVGVAVGPISFPDDGNIIRDTIIDLQMNHTWVGDLVVTVFYDPDCGGPLAPVSTRVLCRPRGTASGRPAPCGTTPTAGASGNLVCTNVYLFSDEGLSRISDGTNPANIAGGCYRGDESLAVFNNLRKGGCWTMNVADRAGADLGTIC